MRGSRFQVPGSKGPYGGWNLFGGRTEMAVTGDCIELEGYRDRFGYVWCWDPIRERSGLARRVAWEAEHGPIPKGGVILFDCRNPACSNVDHLRLGTRSEVTRDTRERGRNGNAKLTRAEAEAIREEPGLLREVASRYGVSESTVSMIRSGKLWPPTSA